MPELPEMETYRRLLTPRIAGKLITGVEIGREKSLNVPAEHFIQNVRDHAMVSIERRAKHLLFQLDTGVVLLLHLMLGGWMFYGREEEKPERTVQVKLSFGDHHLYFLGLRLGYLHMHTVQDAAERLSKLGPEPLDRTFGLEQFISKITSKRGSVKTVMVDQSRIAGIGNCYADEICFDAAIRPTRRTEELTREELAMLYRSMQTVLQEAIRYGGYIERPLALDDGLTGNYNDRCNVYDNEGKPCTRCGHTIELHELNSRKCFYCPNCQR